MTRIDFFLVDISENLLLLLLILLRGLLLALGELCLFRLDLSLALIKLESFLLEDASSFRQVLLLLQDVLFSLAQLTLLLRRELVDH